MKAIRVNQFGGPEVLRLEEVPDPKPGPSQVLIRVHAAGVNPVEAYIRNGTYVFKPQTPYTPGSDAAGTVESVGANVKLFKKGDRVYTGGSVTGTYAQLVLCEEVTVHRLPKNASFEQGAAMGVPYATAYRGLFQRAQAVAGETVLVHGASGGVGQAAVQLAHAAGLTVIGTASTDKGRELVKKQGAQFVLDHSKEGYLDELKQITDGKGVDVILEMLANKNLGKDLTVLAKNGRVVVIGSRGPVEINPRDAMGKDGDIRSMSLLTTSDEQKRAIHAALIAGLEVGALKPVISKEFPLADAAKAHEAIMEPGSYGKIVLKP